MAATVGSVEGAFITYAPQNGSTVNFTTITESSIEPTTQVPLNGLYGQPTASSNSLNFNNLNLRADSTGPSRNTDFMDFVDGQLNVTITAKAQYTIDSLDISEFGDYSLIQSVIQQGRAYARINVPGLFVTVLERNNVAVAPTTVSGTFNWAPPGNKFYLNIIGFADTVPAEGHFSGTSAVNLVVLTGFNDITKVAFSYDNKLFAESTANASAAIAKKGVNISVGSGNLVPEPATFTLLAAPAGLLLLRRRRA